MVHLILDIPQSIPYVQKIWQRELLLILDAVLDQIPQIGVLHGRSDALLVIDLLVNWGNVIIFT